MLPNLFSVRSFADPKRHQYMRVIRNRVLGGIALLGLLIPLIFTSSAWDRHRIERDQLEAIQQAQELIRTDSTTAKSTVIDQRERSWLREINSVGARLNIDWSARLAEVEEALPTDVFINSLRLETSKSELVIKGEVVSSERLKRINERLLESGLNARLTRFARNQEVQSNAGEKAAKPTYEFTITVSWPT
jgi:hypothetical protein